MAMASAKVRLLTLKQNDETTYILRSRTNPQYVRALARTARTTQIQAQIPRGRLQATHSVRSGCVGLLKRVPARPRMTLMITICKHRSFQICGDDENTSPRTCTNAENRFTKSPTIVLRSRDAPRPTPRNVIVLRYQESRGGCSGGTIVL